jgi:hypothetical protein
MAFELSNVVRDNGGSQNIMRGTWTGLASDTENGSVVGRGYATSAIFLSNNSNGPENAIPVRINNSSGTWTVSVPYSFTVDKGTFEIRFI